MAKKCKKLEEIKAMFKDTEIDLNQIETNELQNFMIIFKDQNDTRMQGKVKHLMSDIIMICFLAILARCDGWDEIAMFAVSKEEWLKKFLELPNGIPSHDTMQRVISLLNPETLYSSCIKFLIEKIDELTKDEPLKDVLSMDGKVTKGSGRNKENTEEIKALNTMSIYSHNYGVSLVQDYIEDKSNEIPMGPELIKKLDLTNCILTADALNTQKGTALAIKEAHGDYVLALKKNQKTFYDDVKDYLDDIDVLKEIEKENYAEDVEKSHSKIIIRKYYMTSKISWLENKDKWEKLKSIGVEKKTIESIQTGEVTEENRYFIISFKDDIHSFADAVRKHWGVENNLHAPLDIVFKEDANRTLEKNGARNLGILKRICLAVLKFVQTYYNLSLNKIRFLLSIDFEKEIENVFKLLNTNDIAKAISTKGESVSDMTLPLVGAYYPIAVAAKLVIDDMIEEMEDFSKKVEFVTFQKKKEKGYGSISNYIEDIDPFQEKYFTLFTEIDTFIDVINGKFNSRKELEDAIINEKNDKCIYMLCRSVPCGKIEIVIIEAFYIDNL